MKYCSLEELSRCRTSLMGCAAILVLIVHMTLYVKDLPHFVAKLLEQGNYGVDIFFFCSGMGLACSLKKRNIPLLSWYRKKLKRIYAPYLFCTVPYVLLAYCVGKIDEFDIFLHFTGLQYFVNGKGFWFVSTLLLLYIASPLLYKILFKSKYGMIFALIAGCGIMFVCQYENLEPCVKRFLMLGFVRVPAFLIGMASYKYILNKGILSRKAIFVSLFLCLVFVVILKWYCPLMYSKWLLIFHIMFFFIWVCKNPLMSIVSTFMGKISFESYLYNLVLLNFIHLIIRRPFAVECFSYVLVAEYFLIMLIGTLLAFFTNKFVIKVLK